MSKKQPGFRALIVLAIIAVFVSCPGEVLEDWTKGENFAVTFDANGGEFFGGLTQITFTSSTPRFIGRDFPRPSRPADYAGSSTVFNGYYRTGTGVGKVLESNQYVIASEGFTVYAGWQTVTAAQTDLQNFLDAIAARIGTSWDALTENVTLYIGTDLIDLTWESNDPAHLTGTGKVTRPPFDTADAAVTLTATAVKGNVTATRNFPATVLKEPDYVSIANTAIDAAIASLNTSLGNLAAVTRNLNLPTQLDGVSITWSSSNPANLSNTGVVTRPAHTAQDVTLTLTATLTMAPVTRTYEFTVTIRKMPAPDEQELVDVEDCVERVTEALGNLNAVVRNLTLPTLDNGVTISWSSSNPANLTNGGVVNRPSGSSATVTLTGVFSKGTHELTVPFTVTIVRLPDVNSPGYADLTSKINKANKSLGDLSTVYQTLTLPVSDSSVSVAWYSSNAALSINAAGTSGTVARPTGANHTPLTLTGIFQSVAYPSEIVVKDYPVRVMRSAATVYDFLNVHYKVQDGVFKNVAYSGDYYTPTLMGTAAIATGGGGSYGYVTTGAGTGNNIGYIDLGPKVGALLRRGEFVLEIMIRVPADSGTMMSLANDANINTSTAANWRGTILFHNPALYFKAMNNGGVGSTSGTEQSIDTNATTGNSGGIGSSRINQWVSVSLMRSGNTINIMRNYGRAQSIPGTNVSRITTDPIFGSGDDELDDLRFAYLCRSVLMNSTINGAANVTGGTPANTFIYEFKVWSRAYALVNTTEHPNMAALRADKFTLNDAFGYSDTN